MAQIVYSEQGSAIVFPIRLNPNGAFPIVECVVTNGTGATLTVKDQAGVLLAVALPYLPIDFVCGQSQQLVVTSNGVTILATDVLLIQAFGSPSGLSVPSSYGPSIFAGGAVPNSLQSVIGGQAIAAWMVQQLINLLTGVMTGQAVTISDLLSVQGPVGGFQLFDRDGIGGESFLLQVTNGVMFIQANGGPFNLRMSELGSMILSGRIQTKRGADIAAANNLTLGEDGNVFGILGNTQINLMDTTDWASGSTVILEFAGTPTLKNNQVASGNFFPFALQGSVDRVVTAGSCAQLTLIGGFWFETARMVA